MTDAAVELALEVAEKAARPDFVPEPLDPDRAPGRLRPAMSQADRAFSWSDPTAHVLRRIRAADGSPGVRTELAGLAVSVFDAHCGQPQLARRRSSPGEPGTIALRRARRGARAHRRRGRLGRARPPVPGRSAGRA